MVVHVCFVLRVCGWASMITVRGDGQKGVTFLLKLYFCMHVCVVQMKGCIKVLKEQPSNSVEGLLNALR